MDRIGSIGQVGGSSRDERNRAERLRHRRAAEERCVRTGLLRLCAPVRPAGCGCGA